MSTAATPGSKYAPQEPPEDLQGVFYEVKVYRLYIYKKPDLEATELGFTLLGETITLSDWDGFYMWRKCWFMVTPSFSTEGWVRLWDESGVPQVWPKDPRHEKYEMPCCLHSLRPLCLVVYENDLDELRTLIKLKRNLEIVDSGGQTPLFLASLWSRRDCCILLLKAGANINATQPRPLRDGRGGHAGCEDHPPGDEWPGLQADEPRDSAQGASPG